MKIIDRIKRAARNVAAIGLCALGLLCARRSDAQVAAQSQTSLSQASSMVQPRSWLIFSNTVVSNDAYFGTGSITSTAAIITQFGTNMLYWLTNQSVYAFAPTMIPATGAHEIALTAFIQNSNNFAHSSNIVVTVYPAYDTTGGSTAPVAPRYGQLFSSTPLLSWTITYTTNSVQSTNFTVPQWCPATSLGYTLTNTGTFTAGGNPSNIVLTLVQSDAP